MTRLAALLARAFDAWRDKLPADPCPPLRVLPPPESAYPAYPRSAS